jgi:Sec-independent protein translocase protein TatA
VGFGTELLFVVLLGFLVLGPKQMHAMLGRMAQAKNEVDKITRGLKTQLTAELKTTPGTSKPEPPPD